MKRLLKAGCRNLVVLGMFVLAVTAMTPPTARALDGEAIYREHCSRCHQGGFIGWISGAPKTGDSEVWKKLSVKGIDQIKRNAIQGIGRMDPKGGCEKCTDEEVNAAVDFMLQQTAQ